MELIGLTIKNSYKPIRRIWKKINVRRRFRVLQKWVSWKKRRMRRPVNKAKEEDELILASEGSLNGDVINGDFQPVNGEPLRSTSDKFVAA